MVKVESRVVHGELTEIVAEALVPVDPAPFSSLLHSHVCGFGSVQEDRDDADFRKLKQLGEFSMGLSEERLEQLSAKAVLQTLATLGTLPLTAGQARAVLDKLEEAMP